MRNDHAPTYTELFTRGLKTVADARAMSDLPPEPEWLALMERAEHGYIKVHLPCPTCETCTTTFCVKCRTTEGAVWDDGGLWCYGCSRYLEER